MVSWEVTKELLEILTKFSRKHKVYLAVDASDDIVLHEADTERDDINSMQYVYENGIIWEYSSEANNQNS